MQQSTLRHQLLQLLNFYSVFVFPCLFSAICPVISAFAMSLIIFPLSSVPFSTCKAFSPLPMKLTIFPLSDIVSSTRVDTAVGVRSRTKEQSQISGCADSWLKGCSSLPFIFVRDRARLS